MTQRRLRTTDLQSKALQRIEVQFVFQYRGFVACCSVISLNIRMYGRYCFYGENQHIIVHLAIALAGHIAVISSKSYEKYACIDSTRIRQHTYYYRHPSAITAVVRTNDTVLACCLFAQSTAGHVYIPTTRARADTLKLYSHYKYAYNLHKNLSSYSPSPLSREHVVFNVITVRRVPLGTQTRVHVILL